MAHPSTILLIIFGSLIIIGAIAAEDTGIWNDETLTNTITQTNTSKAVCMGDICYTNYQVSITSNASVNGSPICTPDNGLCNQTLGEVGGNLTGSGSTGSLPLWVTNTTLSDSRLNQSDDRLHSDLGLNFTASARGHALGLGAWVNPANNNQVAIGEGAQANLARSTAIGYNARATAGQRNVAIGNSLVTNTDSVAIIGTASGGECVAISGICSGQRAIAIDGTAGGQNAVNIGYAGSVGGDYSHAVGMRNIVSGDYSQAFGKFLYVIGGTNITLIGQGISHGDRLIQMGSDMLQIGMASETRILMRPDGTISMGDVETSPDATVDITTLDTATVGLIVEAQSGQSANLQEWHNGTGDTALSVNKFGYLTSPTDQVTVTGSDDAGLYIASDGRASRSVVIYNATGTNYGYAGIEGSSGQTFTDSALGSFIIGSSTQRTQFAANGSIALNIGLDQTVGIFDLDPNARLDINTGLTSMIGLIVQGETGQTAHLQTWQNETEDILSYVDANGTIYMKGNEVCTEDNGLCNITTAVNGTYIGFANGTGNITASNINGNIQIFHTESQAGGDLLVTFSTSYATRPECMIIEPSYAYMLGPADEANGDLIINSTHVWIDHDRETWYQIHCYGE